MSWSLFLDEPVDPRGEAPYNVVAGLAIEDRHIWPLTVRLMDANLHYFGRQLRAPNSAYIKAGELLSRETFFYAQRDTAHSQKEQPRVFLDTIAGDSPVSDDQQTVFAQAKISYCRFIVGLIRDYEVRAFAIMAPSNAETISMGTQLRRDYSFLIERFYYFVKDQTVSSMGYLIMSDLNKYSVSANSISDYFLKTKNGKIRSRSIIPDPLIARGRINILFQATSLLAYTLTWAFRTPTMRELIRPEMAEFAETFKSMRYLHISKDGEKDWSFKFIDDIW